MISERGLGPLSISISFKNDSFSGKEATTWLVLMLPTLGFLIISFIDLTRAGLSFISPLLIMPFLRLYFPIAWYLTMVLQLY